MPGLRPPAFAFSLLAAACSPLAAASAQPTWPADAVVYQLFPERFANGDPSNDPTWRSLDFRDRVDSAAWRTTPWTADWYARADWERLAGPSFYNDGVFFRRAGGDLQGVRDRLGHLEALGITTVYFTPVFYAPSLHKYDPASFVHIDPYVGPDPAGDLALIAREQFDDPTTWTWTAADRLFLDLLAEIKTRGMRVVLDGVFNHTGERFPAFESLRAEQRASPYADWYHVLAFDDPATPANEFDWAGWFGFKPLPEFAKRPDPARGDSLNLHPDLRAHLFAATRRWMDPDGDGDPADGVDGWRLDAAEQVPPAFWREWTSFARSVNPDVWLVAEIWFEPGPFLAETGFDAAMNYHGLAIPADGFLYDRRVPADTFAAQIADRYAALGHATALGMLGVLDSHDTDRVPSMIVNGPLGQNYDRGAGPRADARYAVRAPTAEEREVQRAVVTLQMALPGPPLVYYGSEAGMWGGDDPDNRAPMVWPDLAYADAVHHPLGHVREREPVRFDSAMFRFYQSAIALRRGDDVLRRGTLRTVAADATAETVVFERALGLDRRIVAVNRSDSSQFVALPGLRAAEPLVPIFASSGALSAIPSLVAVLDDVAGGVAYGLRVPARTAVVYRPAVPTDVRPAGLDE